ncbi:MAG: esterase, partial [Pseudomonadota bacterium]
MNKKNAVVAALLLLLTVLNAGCAFNRQYRTDYTPCEIGLTDTQCSTNAIQQYVDPKDPDTGYLLGFVEFDDQGQLHDRAQLNFLLRTLNAEAAKNNLLMVVYVHGWKHNAAPGNDNVASFRKSLEELSKLESIASRDEGRQKRKVTGVYLGWRGLSLKVPVLNNLTFWERKNTAHSVGQGAVAEVLARLE